MTRTATRCLSLFLVIMGASGFSVGQVTTGTPPFGSFGGGPFDTVNLASLNVHFEVPVIHKAGRGTPFSYDLSYDSLVWKPVGVSGSQTWQPASNWGWQARWVGAVGYVSALFSSQLCSDLNGNYGTNYIYSNFVYIDPWGTSHPFKGEFDIIDPICRGTSVTQFTSTATDGSGLTLYANYDTGSQTITTRDGVVRYPPLNPGASPASTTITDANGNQITSNSSGVFTDTLGTTALTVAGASPNPVTFSYTSPSGSSVPVTMNFKPYTVQTNFGCSGISEYGPAANVYLVDNITLPDNSKYSFTYEATPAHSPNVTGRIQSVTLPTGGTVTYTYSGGSQGIICADGSTAALTRTLSPGGTWTYSRAQVSGSHWTTTVSDPTTPTANQTVIDFQGIYETQRKVYQGSTSGILLSTTIVCYNGNSVTAPSNCATTAVTLPISRRTAFRYLSDSSGMQAETDTYYNGSGLVTEVDDYDYGSAAVGSLIRKTLITYAALGNGIVGRPATIIIKDGSGNTKASTTYSYDQTSVTATSGTPQHVSVSGSRGNLTTVATQANSAITLYRKFTYYDTGTLNTSTAVSTSSTTNGAATTYNYASGAASCSNSFVTSISEPLSLSRSMTWDCNGGVLTSVTDENGKTASASYTDPDFWRPAKSFDQLSNETDFAYLSPTAAEGTMTFNVGGSVVDHRTALDGLGRPIVSQTLQGPGASNYDSVETDYDVVGRVFKVMLPYTAAAGGLCSGTCPGTTATYDALGRALTITDGGGGSVSNTYTKNDVYQTLGPAPAGENSKQKQFEYDGLGRLTSVCEVTSGTTSFPGGNCAQTNSKTGYWTKYTYDTLRNLTGVTQNAQAASGSQQTRAYIYDMIGRITSETNPETNNTAYTYFYDSLTSDASCGTVTSAGDLLKKVDAMGNVTCFNYDALHRVTSITYPTGTYSASTPKKYYVYDSATVNGTAMSNAKARLAEAYTCTTCPGTKITDLGFSYSARGEITDVWESTTNSTGYYHLTSQYWANGSVNTISGLPGLPTMTYGIDGEGRPKTVSAGTGQNPVTATSYNVSGQVTAVTLGSLDNDAYTFDPNTGRMTQYKFNVGTGPQSVVGNLTWNANSTLKTLAITDPLNSADAQTCNFVHDDMARITSANCGTPWAQTFSFDPFGNLSKSGSASFLPNYSTATNRFTSIPGGTPTYDANGNLTYDVGHSYTWDADSNTTSVDGSTVTMVYDAFDRMAEQTRGSSHTQIVYSPQGSKLALMNGQTLVKAFVALPSGGKAVYTSSGLAYYRHSDHLGSSRLSTTPSRTKYYDVAYAPYGEDYAGSGTQDLSFTDQNQDTVSGGWSAGLYDFLFREYRPAQGRWTSPDPAGLAAVDPSNPQSWNRYAYVLNGPLNVVDPLGLVPPTICLIDGGCPPGGGAGGGMGDCTIVSIDYLVDGVYQGTDDYLNCPGGGGGGGVGGAGGGTPPGGGGGGGGGRGGAGATTQPPAANNGPKPCSASSSTTSIVSGNATTNIPTIAAGAAIGEAIGGPPGAFLGGIIGSFFGVGGTVSYVPSTKSLYAGPTVVFAPALGGGNGFSGNVVSVPAGQNPNSIANGLSGSVTFQPGPLLGSTVVKSPGSPPVVGPSVGTRIPVSFGASYNFPVIKGACQ